ncbi:hypothetical protein RvY_16595 [Ramazzottius varieornatus]|uniref:Uncharacterized protein n=1 Tax=Ramazzottius varieornatus TaxID=947166 RepID=A0A1D1W6H8_RAMVA|nr:hypothetical protein RvY_16595 [Ramazzottius varieornatus]
MVEVAYARRDQIRAFLWTGAASIKDQISTKTSGLDELEFPRTHLHNFAEDDSKALWICEVARDMEIKLEESMKLSCKKQGSLTPMPMTAWLLDPTIKDAYLDTQESRGTAARFSGTSCNCTKQHPGAMATKLPCQLLPLSEPICPSVNRLQRKLQLGL